MATAIFHNKLHEPEDNVKKAHEYNLGRLAFHWDSTAPSPMSDVFVSTWGQDDRKWVHRQTFVRLLKGVVCFVVQVIGQHWIWVNAVKRGGRRIGISNEPALETGKRNLCNLDTTNPVLLKRHAELTCSIMAGIKGSGSLNSVLTSFS